MSYNIKQITNFDPHNTVSKDVKVGGEIRSGLIYNVYTLVDVSQDQEVIKLGYCTNNNEGMNYPIFLTFVNGGEKEFEIGKTGMFEYQPEEWEDVNDDTNKEIKTSNTPVTQIKVYEGVSFVLDYCYLTQIDAGIRVGGS